MFHYQNKRSRLIILNETVFCFEDLLKEIFWDYIGGQKGHRFLCSFFAKVMG